jgi:hypothetical protein
MYKYIFSRAYYFCLNVFKEKEFPQIFASGIVSTIFVGSIIVMVELVEYLCLPIRINTYGKYQGYFSLAMFIAIAILMNKNKNYLKILSDYEAMSVKKRKVLGIWSWIYVSVLLFSFFYLGYLFREYAQVFGVAR